MPGVRTTLAVPIRSDQGSGWVIVFHAGRRQYVPARQGGAKLGIAEYQFILPLIQHVDGFGRVCRHIDGVTTCLENSLKRQTGRQLAVHQQHPGQVQRLSAREYPSSRLKHSAPRNTLTEIADSSATKFWIMSENVDFPRKVLVLKSQEIKEIGVCAYYFPHYGSFPQPGGLLPGCS